MTNSHICDVYGSRATEDTKEKLKEFTDKVKEIKKKKNWYPRTRSEKIWEGKIWDDNKIFKKFYRSLNFIPDDTQYKICQTVTPLLNSLQVYKFFQEKIDLSVKIKVRYYNEKESYDTFLEGKLMNYTFMFNGKYKGSYTRKISEKEIENNFIKELLKGETLYEFNFPEI